MQQESLNFARPKSLKVKIESAREENDKLHEKVKHYRSELDKAAAGPELANLKQEVDTVRAFAGLTELKGPGIKVTLNDSQENLSPGDNPNLYILHDEDVLRVLNELKAAGAEALSMNEHRITALTEVRCIGPTVLINKNVRLSPPFVIKAIGDSNTLYNSLTMKGGVIDKLKFWGIEISLKKESSLAIPPYEGGMNFDYARPTQ
ncbi:MAG: DUF881 domain-containing protein [Clostridiales bacterium]|nr:DUF881 domain-containing protein [Clostridiales bacterium]MCF8021356.1 DUF881 domain-containing protein [Clostridiales bacterium]